MRILLIEDATDLAEAIVRRLTRSGHAVDYQSDGLDASGVLSYQAYDLVILDIGLPRCDGWQLLSELRGRGAQVPVLMLTARTEVDDRVRALDLGADDYLLKPFDFRELDARCRALLRRKQGISAGVTRMGALVFDRAKCCVTLEGGPIELPTREYRLLEIFIGRLGQVISKHEIARQLFGFDDQAGPNAIELYIGRLRKKLGTSSLTIRTVRGVGYIAEAVTVATDG